MEGLLEGLRVHEPSFLSNLLIYPLSDGRGESFLTLEEALSSGVAQVQEGGVISEVELDHQGEGLLFIHEGEEIVGALQNRIFITSMLLERGRRRLPVACVEEGRWSGDGGFTLSGYIAFPSLRATNAKEVTLSLRRTGRFSTSQSSIWEGIREREKGLKVRSRTRAMTETFRACQERIEEGYSDYQPMGDQVGFLIYSNARFLGAEVFSCPEMFTKFCRKLLASYALDALVDASRKRREREIPPQQIMERFSRPQEVTRAKGIGEGEEVRAILSPLVLRALLHKEKVVHLSILHL